MTTINKNIYDLMILQSIAETKLNREIQDPNNSSEENPTRFWNNYVENNKSMIQNINEEESSLLQQLQVSVGAVKSLITDYNEYEGGAGNYTKITTQQLDDILTRYDIIDYRGNNDSGFSATVFKSKDINSNELVISFRSTESIEDNTKDTWGANMEIVTMGTAIAQNISMIKYIEDLKSKNILDGNTEITVTGYSLGSQLASTFYKMYESELNIKELVSFNGPGVGVVNLKATDITLAKENAYVELKNELLNGYNDYLNLFLKALPIFNEYDNNTISILKKFSTFKNDYLEPSTILTQEEKEKLLNYMDIISSLEIDKGHNLNYIFNELNNLTDNNKISILQLNNIEVEQDKKFHADNHKSDIHNIYKTKFYDFYLNYLKLKFELTNTTPFNIPNLFSTAGKLLKNDNIGLEVPESFYNFKATFIAGHGESNSKNNKASDYNIVALSNKYTNPKNLFIEDREEIKLGIGKDFDFGNTHSIFLLNKTLTIMHFLAELENNNFIDIEKYNLILNSTTSEKIELSSPIFSEELDKEISESIGDNNSIAFLINALYSLTHNTNAFTNELIYKNNYIDWANLENFSLLQDKLKNIKEKLDINNDILNIQPLYEINEQNKAIFISKEDFVNKIKQNDNEGYAYRYALEKMNPFVINGFDYNNDYSDLIENYNRSDMWIETRTEILMNLVKNHVFNTGNYLSENPVLISENNLGLKFHTPEEYRLAYKNDSKLFNEIEYKTRPDEGLHKYSFYDNYYQSYSNITINSSYYNTILYKLYPKSEAMLNNEEDIYFLSDMASSYNKNPYKDLRDYKSEKIFINPDIEKIKNSFPETSSQEYVQNNPQEYTNKLISNHTFGYTNTITYTAPFLNKNGIYNIDSLSTDLDFNNKKLYTYVNLGRGNDYVEVSSELIQLEAYRGKKTYYINQAEVVVINDVEKSGFIYLNGIQLNGGDTSISLTERTQTTEKEGIVYTFNYKILNNNNLVITDNEGTMIIIKGVSSFSQMDNLIFNFIPHTHTQYIIEDNLKLDNFINLDMYNNLSIDNYVTEYVPESYYLDRDVFKQSLTINSNILQENRVIFSDNNDIWVYDRTNPTNIEVFKNYLDNGEYRKFHSVLREYEDGILISSVPISEFVSGLEYNTNTPNDIVYIYANSIGINIKDYKGTDKYIIEPTVFSKLYFEKNGLDLIVKNNSIEENNKTIIKNYFAFDHNQNTNFYLSNNLQNSLSIQDLKNYFGLILSNTENDFYEANQFDDRVIFNGGLGNDKIIGSENNEIFQSIAEGNSNISDGNDVFIGGGGDDIFLFENKFGQDLITDFNVGDKIYLKSFEFSNNLNLSNIIRKEDDLIISTNKNYVDNNSITVKNYFNNINYMIDSQIYFLPYYSNNEIDLQKVFWNSNLIDLIQTKELDSTTYEYNQNASSSIKNIFGNELNNSFTINKPITYLVGREKNATHLEYETDGNDSYIIKNHPEPEEVTQNNTYSTTFSNNYNSSFTHEQEYKTTIYFYLNGGHDKVINGLYLKEDEYGDIVVINEPTQTINNIVFNKTNEYVKAILTDGSSITLETTGEEDLDAVFFKINDQFVTNTDLDIYSLPEIILGDDSENKIKMEESFKNLNIKTFEGQDDIRTGFGNDVVEAGQGNDKIKLSLGHDTYIHKIGDGFDSIDLNNLYAPELAEHISITYILDNNFNEDDFRFEYHESDYSLKLFFSENEGIIFKDIYFSHLNHLLPLITLKNENSIELKYPENLTFIPIEENSEEPEEPIDPDPNPNPGYVDKYGTYGDDIIILDSDINNYVYGFEGNDTIFDANGNDWINPGHGNDIIYFESGYDSLYFTENGGVDTLYLNKNNPNSDLFVQVDYTYNPAHTQFYYNDIEQEIYITFNDYDGLILKDLTWQEFIDLSLYNFNLYNSGDIEIPTTAITVNELPFQDPPLVNIIEGDNQDNILINTQYYLPTVIFAKEGNDTITIDNYNDIAIGDKGDDIINIRSGVALFKAGDGNDIINVDEYSYYYQIGILRDNPIVENNENILFELSSSNGMDLILTYNHNANNTSDTIQISNFFAGLDVYTEVSVYSTSNDMTQTITLENIIMNNNVTGNDLMLNNLKIYEDEIWNNYYNQIPVGDLGYQYLNNNYFNNQQGLKQIFDGLQFGSMVQDYNQII